MDSGYLVCASPCVAGDINSLNLLVLIDFEQMDFNWGHACDMIKWKLTMKRLHS